MRILACGDTALLVEVDALADVLGLTAALRADPPPGVVDIVSAARTVLLRCAAKVSDLAAIGDAVRARRPLPSAPSTAGLLQIPVRYDGEDLAEVAELIGLPAGEIVRRHTAGSWDVAFRGFTPGFGYLVPRTPTVSSMPSPPTWALPEIPRRASPRTSVPAGSVALADCYTGVYPRMSPGGWQLIGRTELPVFDASRDPPALLRPGVTVPFVEVAS